MVKSYNKLFNRQDVAWLAGIFQDNEDNGNRLLKWYIIKMSLVAMPVASAAYANNPADIISVCFWPQHASEFDLATLAGD